MNFSEGRQGGCGRTPRTPLNPPLPTYFVHLIKRYQRKVETRVARMLTQQSISVGTYTCLNVRLKLLMNFHDNYQRPENRRLRFS